MKSPQPEVSEFLCEGHPEQCLQILGKSLGTAVVPLEQDGGEEERISLALCQSLDC